MNKSGVGLDTFLQKNIKGMRNQQKKIYSQSVATGEKANVLQKELEEAGIGLMDKLKKSIK